jgi:hypothetical protein
VPSGATVQFYTGSKWTTTRALLPVAPVDIRGSLGTFADLAFDVIVILMIALWLFLSAARQYLVAAAGAAVGGTLVTLASLGLAANADVSVYAGALYLILWVPIGFAGLVAGCWIALRFLPIGGVPRRASVTAFGAGFISIVLVPGGIFASNWLEWTTPFWEWKLPLIAVGVSAALSRLITRRIGR